MGSNTAIPNHGKHKKPMDKGDRLEKAGEEPVMLLGNLIS
jgi:hypothetical protein